LKETLFLQNAETDSRTFLEFAGRGKTAWWRYLIVLAVAGLLTIIISVAILLALILSHLAPANLLKELQQPSQPLAFFLGTGLTFGAVVVSLTVAMRLIQKKRFVDVVGTWAWQMFLLGLGVWLAAQILATLIDLAIAPHDFRIAASSATLPLALYAALALPVQTFAEEFLFRGYLTQALLLATRRPLAAAVLSGLLFGLVHLPNGTVQAVSAMCFGIVCALIAIRTGGIAFTFGLHLVNNFFGAVVVVSAHDVLKGSPGLIIQDSPQLMWWDLSVSIVALIVTLAIVSRRLRTFPESSGREADSNSMPLQGSRQSREEKLAL
jgi:membrane protease YdiL (CAAX protease family)